MARLKAGRFGKQRFDSWHVQVVYTGSWTHRAFFEWVREPFSWGKAAYTWRCTSTPTHALMFCTRNTCSLWHLYGLASCSFPPWFSLHPTPARFGDINCPSSGNINCFYWHITVECFAVTSLGGRSADTSFHCWHQSRDFRYWFVVSFVHKSFFLCQI